jgi:hypothetical protein
MNLKLNGSTGSVIHRSIAASDSLQYPHVASLTAPGGTNGFDRQANDVPGQWGVHPIDTAKQLHDVMVNQWFAGETQSFPRNAPGSGITT